MGGGNDIRQSDPVRRKPREIVAFCDLPAFGMASDREYSTILVEGELYQTQFDRIWELGLEGVAEDSRVKHCKGIQRYTLSNGFTLEPGQAARGYSYGLRLYG